MSTIAFAGPVKNVDALKAFAAEVNGARKAEFVESRKRLGVTRDRVFLMQTPMGPVLSVYSRGLNAGFRMAQVLASSHPFDRFFRESMTKASGVDVSQVPPGPPPHLVFEWSNGKPGKRCTMVAAPVPDPAKLWKFCREMSARYAEHNESRERHGMSLERVFYLHDAKLAVVYLEGDDPQAAMEKSMSSTAAYDKWFFEQISAVHGIDFRGPQPPPPELLIQYDA